MQINQHLRKITPNSEALVSVLSSGDTITVISYFGMWNSLSLLSYYKGPQRNQNNKQAAAGTTDTTLTIPETQ